MAKKILSVLLAVMMIAALCTVAFVSASAAEFANVTFGSETKQVKVGDNVTVKVVLTMKETQSLQGGQFQISSDPEYLKLVTEYNEKTKKEVLDPKTQLGAVSAVANTVPEATNYVCAATEYNEDNTLIGGTYAEFSFTVLKAGETTITEDKSKANFGVFDYTDGGTTSHPAIKAGEAIDDMGVSYAVELIAPTYSQADFAALEAVIEKADAVITDTFDDDYAAVADTAKALKDALAEAKAIVEKDPYDVAQTDVDAAAKKLSDALAAFDAIVDTIPELQAVVDAAKLTADDFKTAADYEAYAAAIEAAKAVIAKGDGATIAEIIAANDAIVKAAAAAGTAEPSPSGDNDNPSDGTTAPSAGGNKTPTGESSTVVFVLLAVIAMAGVAVVVARKRATK